MIISVYFRLLDNQEKDQKYLHTCLEQQTPNLLSKLAHKKVFVATAWIISSVLCMQHLFVSWGNCGTSLAWYLHFKPGWVDLQNPQMNASKFKTTTSMFPCFCHCCINKTYLSPSVVTLLFLAVYFKKEKEGTAKVLKDEM